MNHKKGIWYAIGAYASWGLLPVYWKLLRHVPSVQLLSHRIVWSFFALLAVLIVLRSWRSFLKAAFTPHVIKVYLMAAVLIGINWGTYVWAVNTGHMVEVSLGYFINPLLSVLMGVIFFRERLRQRQWIPIVLAVAGVVYLAVVFGSVPWIALVLALSFALYGAVKKIAPLNSLYGLMMETGILLLPALLFLSFSDYSGAGIFLHAGKLTDVLLVGAGLTTTIPLLMFALQLRKYYCRISAFCNIFLRHCSFYSAFLYTANLFHSAVHRLQYRMGSVDSLRPRRVRCISCIGYNDGNAIRMIRGSLIFEE